MNMSKISHLFNNGASPSAIASIRSGRIN